MTAKDDVYIGRGSIFGNPFTHLKHPTKADFIVNTRTEAISKYREYLLNNPNLMQEIQSLKGKRLFCYCKPLACHGDIIAEILDASQIESLF